MKTLKIMLFVLSAVAVLDSCKKGEDDPLISLRSRKARVVGAWKMTSINATNIYNDAGLTSSSTFTCDGSTYTITDVYGGGYTETTSGTETLVIDFKKDGSYTLTTVRDGITEKESGQWNFTAGIGELKNKSQLTIVSKSTTDSYGTYSTTGNYFNSTYDIKELRNEKIVLSIESNGTGPNSTTTTKYEMVLESK